MSNSYLEFSEVLVIKGKEEKEWLEEEVKDFYSRQTDEQCESGESVDEEEVKKFCEKWGVEEVEDWPGFSCDVSDTEAWFHVEESGNPDNVAKLVQEYLKKFHPDYCWGMEFAYTCSRPKAGEFGGGAVFVTADAVEWVNTGYWLSEQIRQFRERAGPHRGQIGQ